MRKFLLFAAASAVLSVAGQAAAATILFENTLNPNDNGGGFSSSDGQSWAEDATLAVGGTVDQVTWYGSAYYDAPFTDFDINVWADDGSGLPGALVAYRTGAATTTALPGIVDAYGKQTYKFSLDVTPFALSGGAHYHVGISDQGAYNFIWDTSADANSDFIGSANTAWRAYGLAHAFALVNTGGAVSAAPEPAAWALMLAGFAGAGAVLRRGRVQNFA